MEYRIENNILWVKGKLDSSSAAAFETAITELTASLTEQPPRAVLEFSGIETLTSAPLRAMLTLAKRLHAVGGGVVVAAPSANALEALKVSGFLRLQVFQVIAALADLNQEETPPASSPMPSPPQPQPQKTAPMPAPAAIPTHEEPARSLLSRLMEALFFWKR